MVKFYKGHPKIPGAGRPHGSKNKVSKKSKEDEARFRAIASTDPGQTPLQFHTKKYRYYDNIVDQELTRDKPDRDRIDFAFMAGGIAARDAAPYVHARVNPIEEQPQQRVTFEWNWTKELLAKLPDIRRGKHSHPFMLENRDGPVSSVIEEPEKQ